MVEEGDKNRMPMPDHCGLGFRPTIDGIKLTISLRICRDYCTESEDCGDYQAYKIINDLGDMDMEGG